jgi:hypothetical protein
MGNLHLLEFMYGKPMVSVQKGNDLSDQGT